MHNAEIADILSLQSKLMEINGENSFRAKSYSIASFQVEKLTEPLAGMSLSQIIAQKGVGESMGKKILEIIQTGKLASLEKLIEEIPSGVIEMLRIKGLGPKKIHLIWKEMGIASIGELQYACTENRLTNYKGFGKKTQDNVLSSINFLENQKGWFLFAQAEPVAEETLQWLKKQFPLDQTAFTGAFAQHEIVVNVVELVTTVSHKQILEKASPSWQLNVDVQPLDNRAFFKHESGLLIQIDTVLPNQFHYTVVRNSSSPEFIEASDLDTLEGLTLESEAALFARLRLPPIPAYLRTDFNTLQEIREHGLNQVIQATDIKGIIHSHSTWSDGLNSIEEMALQAIAEGYEYLVISDHSQSAAYANGLSPERIFEQHHEIDELNARIKPFKVFKSIESDILGNGNLDYTDDILATFDLVIASVHSALTMSAEKATQRILQAVSNKYVSILGHPTGRLLLSRNGYPLDYAAVIDACKKNHVAIELNAHPRRLDVDYHHIPEIISAGIPISINPDAHASEAYGHVYYGVLAAQKAMVMPGQNLSSFSLAEFENYLSATRKAKGLS